MIPMARLLLISNSTLHGGGYLDHVQAEIRNFVKAPATLAFVPFALYDRRQYASQARERFAQMGYDLISVHDISNPRRAIAEADAVFIGGGNTFRLLKGLYEWNLLATIRQAVNAGIPYIGSSAGSIVACPSLKTTKDMPVVQPPSFDALGLVDFQISPHYLDPDPASTHMGETQEQRILQFLEENEEPVVGLREGGFLHVEGRAITLKGTVGARLFRRAQQPLEVPVGTELENLLVVQPSEVNA
jgi:dipeptidase E